MSARPSSYLLYGRDRFLKKEFIQKLRRDSFAAGEEASANCAEFEPAGAGGVAQALGFLRQAPFLAANKIAVLWGCETLDRKSQDAMLVWLESMPSYAVFVLCADEGSPKNNPFLKKIAEKAKPVACHTPFDSELPTWVRSRFELRKKSASPDCCALVVERTGPHLALLDLAAETLSVYVEPRSGVSAADVSALLGESASGDVFALFDLLIVGRIRQALGLLAKLMRGGARVPEMVGAMAAQLDRLEQAAYLIQEGRTPVEIGRQLGVHSFFLEKFLAQAGKFKKESFGPFWKALRRCDESVKNGTLPEALALDEIIWMIGGTAGIKKN